MRGDLTVADYADEVLEIRDFLIGELVQQARHMMFERAAVFQRLVAQDVERLRADHRRDEIKRGIHVGNNAEQRRFPISEHIQFQLVAYPHVAHFLDVERRETSAAGDQDKFRGLARCSLLRTLRYKTHAV